MNYRHYIPREEIVNGVNRREAHEWLAFRPATPAFILLDYVTIYTIAEEVCGPCQIPQQAYRTVETSQSRPAFQLRGYGKTV